MKKFEIGKNAMYCNAEAVRNYPEVLRGLPFCNWKLDFLMMQMTPAPARMMTTLR